MSATTKKILFGNRTLTLETGVIARQASGAVMVDMDGTTVLVTAVAHTETTGTETFFFFFLDY